jgi:hypothetical protein
MRNIKRENPHVGSSLDDFLKAEGILEETREVTLKQVLIWLATKSNAKAKPE